MTESVAVPSLANLDQVPGARAVARLWLAAWGRKSRWPNAIGGGELMIISASLINSYQFTVSPLWRPVGATRDRPHPLRPTLYRRAVDMYQTRVTRLRYIKQTASIHEECRKMTNPVQGPPPPSLTSEVREREDRPARKDFPASSIELFRSWSLPAGLAVTTRVQDDSVIVEASAQFGGQIIEPPQAEFEILDTSSIASLEEADERTSAGYYPEHLPLVYSPERIERARPVSCAGVTASRTRCSHRIRASSSKTLHIPGAPSDEWTLPMGPARERWWVAG